MENQSTNTLKQFPKLLRVKDVAKLLNLSKSYTYQLINEKQIPHYKVRKMILVSEGSCLEWLQKYQYN